MVTDSTEEEKKMPRKIAAPRVAPVERQREQQRDHGQRRHDHQRQHEGVDQRLAEDRIGEQPGIIVEPDELPAAEQVDAVEAEPMPRSSG